jgi:hypothetical protein
VNVALKRFLIDDPLLFSTRSCRTYYDALICLNKNEAHNLVYSQPAGKPASLHAIYFPQSEDFHIVLLSKCQNKVLFLSISRAQCMTMRLPSDRTNIYFLYFLYSSCTMHDTATVKCQNNSVFLSIFSILHVQYMTMREVPSTKLQFFLYSLYSSCRMHNNANAKSFFVPPLLINAW